MTDTSNVFSDYIKTRENFRNVGVNLNLGAPVTSTPSGTNRGWLGTVVDFLNIGVYPGTNIANEFLTLTEKTEDIQAKAAAGRTGEAFSDSAKIVGNILTAPVRGVAAPFMRAFGAELPEGSGETWDKVIERTVDVSNRNNPNYVDVENNANTIAKGGLGLALDIVADPLTWVSLGTVGAAKAFSRGAGAVATTAKTARAGQNLLEGANKVPVAPQVTASEAIARNIPEAAALPSLSRAAQLSTATPAAFKAAPADNFPASTITERIIKDVEDAPLNSKAAEDVVNETLRKTIDSKMVDVPGLGKSNLRTGLDNFFKFLKTSAVTAPTAKIVENFGSYVNLLKKDAEVGNAAVRIEAVLPSYRPAPISGSSAAIPRTLDGALAQYDQVRKVDTPAARAIREAIETRILLPLQQRYNKAVRAGHDVNTFMIPKTASAAVEVAESSNVADIVLRNLQTLDDANKARGIALMGEDFFNAVAGMQSSQLSKILDDLTAVLQTNGALDNVSALLQNDVGSKFLKLFDIDNTIYAAAKADVAQRFEAASQGVRQTDLEDTLTKIDEDPVVLEDLAENLSLFGMTQIRFDFLKGESGAANAAKVFDAIVDSLKAGANALKINFSPKRRKDTGHTFQTDNGAFRTEEILGEGTGVIPNALNSYGQMNYIVAIGVRLNKYFNSAEGLPFLNNLKGFAKISAKQATTLAAIKTVENAMEAKGVPIFMDFVSDVGNATISRSLKFSQVYETLAESANQAIRIAMFNPNTGVAITKLTDAVMTAIVSGDRAEVLKVLRSTETRYKKQAPNWLANPNATIKVGPGTYKSSELSEQLADAIIANVPKFEDFAEINARAYRSRGLAEGEAISSTTAEIIVKMLNDPTKIAQSGIAVAKAGRVLGDVANTVGNVSNLGMEIGNMRVVLGLGENFQASAETTLALVQQILKQSPEGISRTREASYRQGEKIYEDSERAAYKAVEDFLNGRAEITNPNTQKLIDDVVGEAVDSSLNSMRAVVNGAYGRTKAAVSKGWNFLDKFFNVNRGLGVENNLFVKQRYSSIENIQERLAREILQPVAQIGKKYTGFADEAKTTTIVQEAFNAIRNGTQASGEAGRAQRELLPLFAKFFNLGGDTANSLMGNLILRQGGSLERVNEILAARRVLETTSGKIAKTPDEYYDLGKIAEELGPNPTPEQVMNALSEQWKTWDIQDPINFLDRYTRAVSQVIGETVYVSGFRAEALALGLASIKPQTGFVKLSPGDGTTLGKHLQEDLWVDPDVGEAFVNISNFMDELSTVSRSQMENYIDEFTDAFKYAATQARLGHHVRNFAGGLSMTGAGAGIKHFGKAFEEAVAVKKLVDGSSTEADLIVLLDNISKGLRTTVSNVPEAQRVAYKGVKGQVTRGELAEAIARLGINPNVRQAEAFASMGGAEGRVGRWTQKFLSATSFTLAARGGRMEEMWSKLSMLQDHVNRDHMFIQLVMQALDGKKMPRGIGRLVKFDFNKPDVMEDIYAYAAERVLKFHPTGQILTALERKIPRRLFPFYAWNKGAVMALSETITMYPSRMSWPFKASYNLSVAMGVDPNSYYDPFPTDQKFPSFMTEDINGPQFVVNGNYYGFQPGLAQFDVLNQFGGSEDALDPIWTAAVSSLNPGIKVPIELITRSRLQTGNPIADLSDYVDSSIPNVSYGVNFSTYSPSSIIIDGQLEQNAKYEAGDKTNLSRILSLLNWGSGFGFTEYSRPDLRRLGDIEENVRFAEERERRYGQ